MLILASTVTGCVSVSAFASLVGIPVGITSFAATVKICVELQESKSISQLSRKKGRSMIK